MALFNFGKPKDEQLEQKLQKIQKEIDAKKKELEQLNYEIAIANDVLEIQEIGFFERQYKFSDSSKYKSELDLLRTMQKQLVKEEKAGNILAPLYLDGNKAKGRAMQKQLIKAALRGFNGEADSLLVKITASNVQQKIKALHKSFEQLNKMYARNMIAISDKYLSLKIGELQLAAEYELQKQEEKELLREQREKEREDKKLQNEIKNRRKKLEKDRTHFQNMIDKVNDMITTADDNEVEILKSQLNEYQNKMIELDEIEEDIDYREGHASAGYVYIISNIGSFGEDVYKIGVTRRLEPLDRIRELSSASVPFQFDVHVLIFSEEAFALEAELHNELAEYKVNKVNGRKEYFKVPFSKIRETLDNHPELTIEINDVPDAFEYRQTLKLGGEKV